MLMMMTMIPIRCHLQWNLVRSSVHVFWFSHAGVYLLCHSDGKTNRNLFGCTLRFYVKPGLLQIFYSFVALDFDVRKFTNVLDIAKLLQELANQNEQDNTSKSSSNNIYRRLKQSVPTKSMNDAEAGEDMCSIHEVLMCKMETLVASSVFVTQNNQVP